MLSPEICPQSRPESRPQAGGSRTGGGWGLAGAPRGGRGAVPKGPGSRSVACPTPGVMGPWRFLLKPPGSRGAGACRQGPSLGAFRRQFCSCPSWFVVAGNRRLEDEPDFRDNFSLLKSLGIARRGFWSLQALLQRRGSPLLAAGRRAWRWQRPAPARPRHRGARQRCSSPCPLPVAGLSPGARGFQSPSLKPPAEDPQ